LLAREASLPIGRPKTPSSAILRLSASATKRLSPSLKDAHPDISWKPIAGMRDKLIHDYFGINLQLVWDVVERDLLALKLKVSQLIKTHDQKS